MQKILRVAMLGHGFMGRAHSNAFHQVNRFFSLPYRLELKVVCGRNRPALEAMAAQWGWENIETDWRAAVSRDDIDVVDIATPNALHAAPAIAAAEAGKIVFCEKPLAMNVAEAQHMAEAAKKVPNLVWFNYRRVPAIAYTKQLIEQGKLGEIYQYRATYLQSWGPRRAPSETWRFDRSQAGSGAVGDLLSHLVDSALMLNGPIAELCGMTHTFAPGREVDDAVFLQARFRNGSVGSFEATRYATGYQNRNRFEIHGSRGMIGFNLEDLNRLEFFDATAEPSLQGIRSILVTGPTHPYSPHFWPPGHIIGYEHTFIATLADFLTALAKNQPFHANFDDALAVQEILAAAEESSVARRWITLGETQAGSGQK
jgi:predicted dehydrogenase